MRDCGGLRLLWQERICRLWPSAGAASMWPPVGMACPRRLGLVVLGAARLSVTAAARARAWDGGRAVAGSPGRARVRYRSGPVF